MIQVTYYCGHRENMINYLRSGTDIQNSDDHIFPILFNAGNNKMNEQKKGTSK